MSITLKQLAQEAGVSMATVSLALNNSPIVAEKTKLRIQELAGKRNYQPNMVAKSLAGRGTKLIGVLIDSHAPRILFQTIAHIEREAAARGYRIMIGEAHDNVAHLYEIYEMFKQYRTEAIICLAHDYPGQEVEFKKYFDGKPDIVYIGKPQLEYASYIDIDRDKAIADSVSHLHEQGYQKVGIICNRVEFDSSKRRKEAFFKIMSQNGINDIETLIYFWDNEDGMKNCERIITEKIIPGHMDAVIAESDSTAAILCKSLIKHGYSVPEDVGVIGSDNDDICKYCTPELSSIDDLQKLKAVYSIRMLTEMLSDKSAEEHIFRNLIIQSQLVTRESSLRVTCSKLSSMCS